MKHANKEVVEAMQKVVAWSVLVALIFLCDIFVSMVITFPFSLITKNWSYWAYTLPAIVFIQMVIVLLILNKKLHRGGDQ